MAAARDVSTFFQTDDSGAKHTEKNGHTLHIGNDLFAYCVVACGIDRALMARHFAKELTE